MQVRLPRGSTGMPLIGRDRKINEFQQLRCVFEATRTYRWLYNLLSPVGIVLSAKHPDRLDAT